MAEERRKHLNSEESKREFERRYGKEHGDLVWGETMGKVAREQAARNPSGVKVEHVPSHISFSKTGKREVVRGHDAYIQTHPHSRGHHGGRCDGNCRRGIRPHKHRSGSSSRG